MAGGEEDTGTVVCADYTVGHTGPLTVSRLGTGDDAVTPWWGRQDAAIYGAAGLVLILVVVTRTRIWGPLLVDGRTGFSVIVVMGIMFFGLPMFAGVVANACNLQARKVPQMLLGLWAMRPGVPDVSGTFTKRAGGSVMVIPPRRWPRPLPGWVDVVAPEELEGRRLFVDEGTAGTLAPGVYTISAYRCDDSGWSSVDAYDGFAKFDPSYPGIPVVAATALWVEDGEMAA
jgi:hypothetical protein